MGSEWQGEREKGKVEGDLGRPAQPATYHAPPYISTSAPHTASLPSSRPPLTYYRKKTETGQNLVKASESRGLPGRAPHRPPGGTPSLAVCLVSDSTLPTT